MADPAAHHQPTLPGLALREGLRTLRAKIGRQLTALARGLYEVSTTGLYREWGFSTFQDYARDELDLEPAQATKLARLYLSFGAVWSEAAKQPASRLLPALTLVESGKHTAEDVVRRIAGEQLTTQAVRQWVRDERAKQAPPLPGTTDKGTLTWADPLPVLPGIELLQRSGHPGRADDAVVVKLTLGVPTYRAFVLALAATPGGLSAQLQTLLTPHDP